MSIVGLVYFIIKWIEALVLYFFGKQMEYSSSKKSYWMAAIFPIIVFGLAEGLRWGHMYDYNVYAERYAAINAFFTMEEQSSPLFTIIVYTLKCIGISYQAFLVLQCAFLLTSSLVFLQEYKRYLRWALPLLLMAFSQNENVIRFYLSQSFMFIALYYYFKGKSDKKAFIYACCSCLIHFGQLPFVVMLFSLRLLNVKKIPRLYAIIAFILATFVISVSDMTFLVKWANLITSYFGGSDYQLFAYLDSMDEIVSGEAGRMGIIVAKLSTQLKSLISFLPLIILGEKFLSQEKYGNMIYNLMIINIVLSPIFGQVELLMRFCYSFNIFVVIVMAIVLKKLFKDNKIQSHLLGSLILFCYMYAFLNSPFVRQDYEMYYIWDSYGKVTNWGPYLK